MFIRTVVAVKPRSRTDKHSVGGTTSPSEQRSRSTGSCGLWNVVAPGTSLLTFLQRWSGKWAMGGRAGRLSIRGVCPRRRAGSAEMTLVAARFIGGMNVPSRVGRVNASRPLAELTVGDDAMTLRPRWFARWVLRDVVIPLDQVTAVFPLRGRWMTRGIGVAMSWGQVAYFWTTQSDEVLAALHTAGVTVDPVPRPASAVWSWREVPTGPGDSLRLPRLLIVVWPVLALLSLGLLLVVITHTELGWFRWIVALFWLVGLGIGAITWLRARRPNQ